MNEAILNRAIIRLSGDDRRTFLQGLITQDVDQLEPNRAIFAALLTPQGKIRFDFFVYDTGTAFLIDCDSDAAAALSKALTLYKLRAAIVLEPFPNHVVSAHWGHSIKSECEHSFEDPRCSALGQRSIFESPGNSGALPVEPLMAYHDHRIQLGVPHFGLELSDPLSDFCLDEVFLLDVNYDTLSAVSYKKGCFVGQEVTSRMKRKGDVRKRTLIAEFEGPPPAKGAAVTAGESTLGEILSGVDGRALALIRLDRWEKARAGGLAPVCEGRPLQLMVPDYIKQD